jgi:hypothetical protein
MESGRRKVNCSPSIRELSLGWAASRRNDRSGRPLQLTVPSAGQGLHIVHGYRVSCALLGPLFVLCAVFVLGSASGAVVSFREPAEGSVAASATIAVALDVADFSFSGQDAGGPEPGGFALVTLDGAVSKNATTPATWFSNVSAGAHILVVQLVMANGTPVGAAATANFSVAAAAPRLKVVEPSSASVTNASSLEARVYVEIGGVPETSPGVRWSIDGRTLGIYNSSALSVTALSAGSHNLRAELVGGNQSSLSPGVWDEVVFDLSAGSPFVHITLPAPGETIRFVWAVLFVETRNFSLSARGDPGPGKGQYRILVDGAQTGIGTDALGIATGLNAGPHRITVELTDMAGATLVPRVWDEVAIEGLGLEPTISIVSPLNGSVHWGDLVNVSVAVANFTLSELADGHVDYYVDGLLEAMIPADHYTTAPLAAGIHTLSVGLSPPGHYRYPIVEPSVEVIVVPPPTVAIVNPPTGTTVEGSAVEISLRVDGTNFVDPRSGLTLDTAQFLVFVDNASRGVAGGTQIEISGLATGTHDIRLIPVDGNGSAIPGANSATIVVNVRGPSPWPSYAAVGIVSVAGVVVGAKTWRNRRAKGGDGTSDWPTRRDPGP